MTEILQEISAERERQITREGWSSAHDDEHCKGEMAFAAACYASPDKIYRHHDEYADCIVFRDAWPWGNTWDKRDKHDRRRQLVIAAALIVAEIERLDRASSLKTKKD